MPRCSHQQDDELPADVNSGSIRNSRHLGNTTMSSSRGYNRRRSNEEQHRRSSWVKEVPSSNLAASEDKPQQNGDNNRKDQLARHTNKDEGSHQSGVACHLSQKKINVWNSRRRPKGKPRKIPGSDHGNNDEDGEANIVPQRETEASQKITMEQLSKEVGQGHDIAKGQGAAKRAARRSSRRQMHEKAKATAIGGKGVLQDDVLRQRNGTGRPEPEKSAKKVLLLLKKVPAEEAEKSVSTAASNSSEEVPLGDHKNCVLCDKNPRSAVLKPCRHVCVCPLCASNLLAKNRCCPWCPAGQKIEVIESIRIHRFDEEFCADIKSASVRAKRNQGTPSISHTGRPSRCFTGSHVNRTPPALYKSHANQLLTC